MAAVDTHQIGEGSPFASWTIFNSMVTKTHTEKSVLDFFPIIPYPPKESILKDYLDFLLDLKKDLDVEFIFCHSDQDVFYKMSQIVWKEKKVRWNNQYHGWFPYSFS